MDRSGTLPFMSLRLVFAWSLNRPVLHTAADDLESFLWVLVWSLVYNIFKEVATITDESAIIACLARAFSTYSYVDTLNEEFFIMDGWPDKVFGGLIQEWLVTSAESRRFLRELDNTLSGSRYDMSSQKRARDGLEKHCREVYIKFIRAGYSHLEKIRDWKAVMDENGEKLYR